MTTATSTSPIASSSSTTAGSGASGRKAGEGRAPFCKIELPLDAADWQWGLPPAKLILGRREVHVWRVWLDCAEPGGDGLGALLSPDERARAQRYCFEQDRRRFMAGRGLLRVILSRYLRVEPARLEFFHGAHGKPYLPPGDGGVPLEFNLAHANALAIVAIAQGRAVGVDVERVHVVKDAELVAAQFFSPREQAQLRTMRESREMGFLHFWTGKEACAKAVGLGLGNDLSRLDVAGEGGRLASWVDLNDERGHGTFCELAGFEPAEDYVAAIAVCPEKDVAVEP